MGIFMGIFLTNLLVVISDSRYVMNVYCHSCIKTSNQHLRLSLFMLSHIPCMKDFYHFRTHLDFLLSAALTYIMTIDFELLHVERKDHNLNVEIFFFPALEVGNCR